uniref:Collar domain-containing protein n=1 Tax=Glossina brevipalpis TaxID=37001 RepID=A0A1A9X0N9_9MUSC
MENDDMSYLKETAAWEDGIYQIETSDPVLGGPDGITNRPTRELVNRTAWLKQQLKEAEAALTAHTRSRNHPDASVSEKGFVKLSNANQSSSETEAATPKAVKIVNDRLNAVIDSAPSTLDTLNKLAKAIDNNPKFAEKLNQLLEQKLSKNDNAKNATPNQRKINGKTLTQDVQLTATDVHAVTPEVLRSEIPVGVPLPWPTERAPTGWFICNGELFDKKKYPLLALAYPSGKLPDLRGEFIRGWDAGRGVNPGRRVLSSETGSLESHAHGYRDRYYVEHEGSLRSANNKEKMQGGYNGNTGSGRTDGDNNSYLFIDKITSNAGGSETRPRNVAFNYIVRAA